MVFILRGSCGRFIKLRGVLRIVYKIYLSIDVIKKDCILDRVKKFVFGEGLFEEEDEIFER